MSKNDEAEIAANVEKARATLAELQSQRAGLADQVAALRAQKPTLAYDAATGKSALRAKLRDVNRELATAVLELEDFDSAIKTAEAKLSKAEATAAALAERKRIDAALQALEPAKRRAAAAEEHLKLALENITAVFDDVRAAEKAGAFAPSLPLMQVNFARALQLFLRPLKLNAIAIERNQQTVGQLFAGYIGAAERSLKAKRARVGVAPPPPSPKTQVSAPDEEVHAAPASAKSPEPSTGEAFESFRLSADEYKDDEAAA